MIIRIHFFSSLKSQFSSVKFRAYKADFFDVYSEQTKMSCQHEFKKVLLLYTLNEHQIQNCNWTYLLGFHKKIR